MRPGLKWQILWIACLLICLARLIPVVHQAATRPSHGFHSYYTAARLLVSDVDVQQFYDHEWFQAASRRIQPDAEDRFAPNMPTTAYLLLPLASLDYLTARIIWTLLGLLVLSLAFVITLRELNLPKSAWLPAALMVLLYQPLYAQLAQAQAYLLVTGLLVLTWWGYRHHRANITGVALGFMFILKSAGALLFILLLVQKRWRALLWACATCSFIGLITLPRIGMQAWLTYVPNLREFSAQPFTQSVAYQTLPSLLKRLFVADSQWNLHPLFDIPTLGILLPPMATVLIIAVTIFALKCRLEHDRAFAAFVTAGIIISPFSGDYHYLLLLLPCAILATQSDTLPQRLLLIAGIGLIGIHFDLESLLQIHPLLAYPKLMGAFIIWGLALSPVSKMQASHFAVR